MSVAEIAELARRAGRLAFDTEFMGEGRYRTLLCLIQVAVPEGESGLLIELLDPLDDNLSVGPLAEVMADPSVEKILHAGRQDVALVRRRMGTEVRNVFDTQVAAGFAGLAAQASYDHLLTEVLGLRLAKSASYTRWDRRPLSPEQREYAREDVLHLIELADELQRRLRESGRLEWARQECAILESASDERDLDAIFLRLPRLRSLRPEAQAVARELVHWREETARSQDRPVQTVLKDAALMEIAKRRPATVADLESLRGVNPGSLRRRASDLLEAVARGREHPPPSLPKDARGPLPEGADAPLIALGEALVRARTREAGLAYELVAARADLQAIVSAWRTGAPEPAVRTLEGWRRELVGAELLRLLDGAVTLSVDPRTRAVSALDRSGAG